ncbi:MAG: glycosyltransferase, partial [Fimbriimonas ginsengisoli]|nr:glycosyltransferase [Fimbriimonas ginsengisoli]
MTILQAGGSLHDWGGIERYVLYLAEGLGARGHRSVVACPPGSPLAMRVGDRAVPLSFRSRYSPLAVARLLRLVCGLRPDVLHAHFSPEYRVAGLAGRLGRVPKVVLTRHVALKWSPRRVRGILALYDHIIATSEAT